MSINSKESIKCPKCSHLQDVTMWSSITADDNDDLKKELLGAYINVFHCENCSYKALLPNPLLYQDKSKKLMISFTPTNTEQEKIALFENIKKTSKKSGELEKLENFNLRFVTNYDTLLEKILIFDNDLHDKVIEVIKVLILMQEPEKSEQRIALFGKKDNENLEFIVKDTKENQIYTSKIPLSTYEHIKTQLKESGVKYKSFDWEIIDINYGTSLLYGINNNIQEG